MESNRASPSIALPLLALSSFFFALAVSDSRFTEVGLYCNHSTEIVTRNVAPNLEAVLTEISENLTNQYRYRGNYSVTSTLPGVYGLAQCHGDLIETNCLSCFAESQTRIHLCLPNFGRLYLDGCFLRFDGYDFYNETVDPTHDILNCGSNSTVPVLVWGGALFWDRVDRVLRNVLASALQNGGYAVTWEYGDEAVAGVYALAQCWSTLNAGGCRVCLENAASKARNCTPGGEARAMNAGCFLRYSTTKFYNVPESGEGLYCNNSTEIVTRNVLPNFGAVMREISKSVADQRRGNYSITSLPPGVYGLAQCHGDLIETDCRSCFAESRTRIPRCLPNFGRLYLDGCFLRYDGYDFYNETVDPTHDMLNCSSNSTVLVWKAAEFWDRLDRVLRNVLASALQNGGFAVAGEDGAEGAAGVYALAQCWSTLDAGGCRVCLENAASKARSCTPGGEARAMNAGCFLRYSTTKFYNVPVSGVSYEVCITIAIASSAAAISLVLISAYIGYKKYSKKKQVQNGLVQLRASMSKFRLYFNYETLEKATNFFDDSRKLGQGSGGSVYKGILPNKKVVAVKRLVINTQQWADDLFNEVNLISGIQHKNLVKLLGCSIEGPESLLVYEYLSNKSLDQVLLVNNATHVFTWEERLHIITGIAEGLTYLHGGCGMKIIHRDIKASNILLDENLMAKIADFGLARCIALDKSHLSTGIAGTIGYMAPEYLVRGQLTEKADVYAFGVLVLEILTGRKNSVYTQGSSSVLQSVWKHYKSNNLAACIDPALQGKFLVLEASNVLQIGLLCTQASMELRPPMSGVVEMLHDKDRVVPQPNQPPFLNASELFDKSSSRSSTCTHGC